MKLEGIVGLDTFYEFAKLDSVVEKSLFFTIVLSAWTAITASASPFRIRAIRYYSFTRKLICCFLLFADDPRPRIVRKRS